MTERNSNKESKLRLIAAAVNIRSKLCPYTNLYKSFRHVCFFLILNLYQHLMCSLDLKTVDKDVYRRENTSV
jgi:tRNA uridine 5-carbamoylmethylation protein Kti12